MLTNDRVMSRALIVESVAGHDPLNASRKREVVTARALLVWSFFMDGCTEKAVADAIGWDRGAVHHYRDIFRDALQYGNRPELVDGWNKLRKILDK